MLRGLEYFYEWQDGEAGLLRFENAAPLGWVLAEGRGARSGPLSDATWATIAISLAAWPALAPVWVDTNGAALGTWFLRRQMF